MHWDLNWPEEWVRVWLVVLYLAINYRLCNPPTPLHEDSWDGEYRKWMAVCIQYLISVNIMVHWSNCKRYTVTEWLDVGLTTGKCSLSSLVLLLFSWTLALKLILWLSSSQLQIYSLSTLICVGGGGYSLFLLLVVRRQTVSHHGPVHHTGPRRDKQPSALTFTTEDNSELAILEVCRCADKRLGKKK